MRNYEILKNWNSIWVCQKDCIDEAIEYLDWRGNWIRQNRENIKNCENWREYNRRTDTNE